MSFVVRDVPFPKNCKDCPCYQDAWSFYPYCNAKKESYYAYPNVEGFRIDKDGNGKPKWCPLFEVKDWREV